jgi:hypothetical protein
LLILLCRTASPQRKMLTTLLTECFKNFRAREIEILTVSFSAFSDDVNSLKSLLEESVEQGAKIKIILVDPDYELMDKLRSDPTDSKENSRKIIQVTIYYFGGNNFKDDGENS